MKTSINALVFAALLALAGCTSVKVDQVDSAHGRITFTAG
jgi:hypothetical protein